MQGDGDAALRELLEQPEIWQPTHGADAGAHAAGDEMPDHEARARHPASAWASTTSRRTWPATASTASCCIRCSGRCCWRCCCSWSSRRCSPGPSCRWTLIEARDRLAGQRTSARWLPDGLPAQLHRRRTDRRRRRRARVPAADPDPVLLHPRAGGVGLPAARGLPARPHDGRRRACRAARFIPLLSSFACAIPGIMATRTIANPRDRLVTIMIAPMMTCSARLPVYALLIGAFIPQRERRAGLRAAGPGAVRRCTSPASLGSLAVAWVLKRITARGAGAPADDGAAHATTGRTCATWRSACGSARRSSCARVGGIILALTIALWFLASFPAPPPGATRPGHRVQPGRHAGHGAGGGARADRLQLADQHRAGAGPGRARSGGERAGHGLRAVGDRRATPRRR